MRFVTGMLLIYCSNLLIGLLDMDIDLEPISSGVIKEQRDVLEFTWDFFKVKLNIVWPLNSGLEF